jgi:endoglucanase
MKRRTVLAGILAAILQSNSCPAQAVEPELPQTLSGLLHAWEAWKAAYLTQEGRVIDVLQNGASHSESQGYGLFLAATFQDLPAFETIFRWTERNLAIRPDALLAWRWFPDTSGKLVDINNASDGDLFYAWGLVRMAKLVASAELHDRAKAIVRDLARLCIVPHPNGSDRILFVPAADGFSHDGGVIVNFSYYMPMAMRELAQATGIATLEDCATDGEVLMAGLAADGLMPNWIQIGPSGNSSAQGMSDHSGYEALRIAPFLAWSGRADHPAVVMQVKAYRAAARDAGNTPTVFDRKTADVIESSPNAGYAAISALIDCAIESDSGAALPDFSTDQPYYPATLHLMTLIAQATVFPRCFPL